MVETVIYKGKKYNRYPESEHRSDRVYFKRSITGGTVFLHRQIWLDAHGEIPKGMHIHHIDGNPLNNDISNLECLTAKDHISEHEWDDDRRASNKLLLERIRPLTKAWHSSPEGIEKHREIGRMAWAKFEPIDLTCKHCSSVFKSTKVGHSNKFCSNSCKSAWRRKEGLDNVEKNCELCGSAFTTNKYSKVRFCTRTCAQRSRVGSSKKGL